MFLRKWTFGKVAVGLLVAAFLVLGGVNVKGLMEGQEVINKAESRRFHINARIGYKFGNVVGCQIGGANCLEITIWFGKSETTIELSREGLFVD
ncbi:MAG TPA: hypothetical protein VNL73_10340 [Verrucomicrobiae bacterium]|nr:hypothetical protein [Verrucomicrobiae bacterium]